MAKFVSMRNPISARSLKRRKLGSVIVHHWGRDCEVRLMRCVGGWLLKKEDSIWIWPPVIMSSADVARECNKALGCKESWARVY